MSEGDVTAILEQIEAGDESAFDRLLPLVYDELRRVAGRQMRRERAGHTLHPTALVHEAYLKLMQRPPSARSRSHFLAIAGRAMRQILVDHARRHGADKRGGDWVRTELTGFGEERGVAPEELLALDAALERLDALDPRLRRVVECRFFAGMTQEQIAAALGVTTRTVERDWAKARAWLYKELYPEDR